MNSGAFLSFFSAALFGVSPALAKLVMGEMSPVLLAGLLYLGSGVGLQLFLSFQKQNSFTAIRGLSKKAKLKLLGAIISGGILAPLCLAYGIKFGSAFEVSLLLNLETVATTLIAWLVFHEYIGRSVWIGKLLLVVGALIISLNFKNGFGFSDAGILLIAACVFWGIDNNLTRDVEDLNPAVLASVKGWVAGGFNTLLALSLGQFQVGFNQGLGTLAIGAFSYGLSLVLFVKALRLIGASRTSTYFAVGPFFGMIFSVLLLNERPDHSQWFAAVLMALGLWTLYRERHSHPHTHEPLTHSHKHTHDEHHQHLHSGSEGPEPHEHLHTHQPITHSHPHLPDVHHRHRH
jgi:drug/metabolite transporter (DMT)-like permease